MLITGRDSQTLAKDASAGSTDLRLPHGEIRSFMTTREPHAIRLSPCCALQKANMGDARDLRTMTLRDVEPVSPWLEGLPSSSQKSWSSALSLMHATSAGNSGAHSAVMVPERSVGSRLALWHSFVAISRAMQESKHRVSRHAADQN